MNEIRITGEQIKMIHTLKSVLKLDEEIYRAMLEGQYHVSSSKELTFLQAKGLIGILEKRAVSSGVWSKRVDRRQKYKELGFREDKATDKQLRMIESLWVSRSMNKTNESLDKFIKRITKRDNLLSLYKEDVPNVISAIKHLKRKYKKAEAIK